MYPKSLDAVNPFVVRRGRDDVRDDLRRRLYRRVRGRPPRVRGAPRPPPPLLGVAHRYRRSAEPRSRPEGSVPGPLGRRPLVCEDHGKLRRSRVSRETGLVERFKLWRTALGSHLPNGPGQAPGGGRWTARAARQGQHLPLIEAEGLIGRRGRGSLTGSIDDTPAKTRHPGDCVAAQTSGFRICSRRRRRPPTRF